MIQAALLLSLAPLLQDDPSALRVEDYRAHVTYFASEELEGRESGKEGGHKAARYAAAHFEKLGLKPVAADGAFLLPFQTRGLECFNTAGLLPGTDPELAGEILVIGGHHDHAGIGGPGAMGSPGQIHNGADDNASGSCGVLELAEYFVAHPTRRPILFMTFSGEERGLIGSSDFVRNGPVPVGNMRAMINLDMIGRSTNDYLFVGGLGTAAEFHALLDDVLEASALDLETNDAGEAPSDNTPFYKAGVPALFFFTNIHDDYHMPGDDADKINYEGALAVLDLVRQVAERLNNADAALSYERKPGMAMPEDFNRKMAQHFRKVAEVNRQRGRLGITPGAAAGGGLEVDKVTPGSAAEKAGLKPGDLLLSVDGRATPDLEQLRRALGGKRKGDPVLLLLQRGGVEMSVRATLQ